MMEKRGDLKNVLQNLKKRDLKFCSGAKFCGAEQNFVERSGTKF